MRLKKFLTGLTAIFSVSYIHAQEIDSSYIKSYPQKYRISGYLSTSSLEVDDTDRHYTPNYPLNTGIGFAIKNTIVGIQLGYGFIPLTDKKKYGKTKTRDFQIHHYGRKMIFDIFFQDYRGFYVEKDKDENPDIYQQMSVKQIGMEATYLFNGKRFSSKAAFDLDEIQRHSAGSWLVGGGGYYYQLKGMERSGSEGTYGLENFQLGINGGYAYSWVMSERWMMTGTIQAGANFGNALKSLKKGRVEVYPTAFARIAGNYHKNNWGISFAILINNKTVYPVKKEELSLTAITMQLSYVKHLDHIFKSKNK